MKAAAAIWLLTTSTAVAQAPPGPAAAVAPASSPQQEQRRFPRATGGDEAAPTPPDLSADFDPFAPDDTPPPKAARFDPRRLSLAPRSDPLAALIRNGPAGATLSPAQSPEPWMLPGTRRAPTLGDPPPGSDPASRPATRPATRPGPEG